MQREEIARNRFDSGYNCCQSVLLAFADRIPLCEADALRLSASFGAGMGRLREVCGALSAAFMVCGFVLGPCDPLDADAKAAHYRRIQQLAAAFAQQNGSILCRDLLGLPDGPDDPTPRARTAAYYRERPCAALVASAARILDRMLREAEAPAPSFPCNP